MTISQTQLDQALSEIEIAKFWLGYFQEAYREQAHQQLLEIFEHLHERGFTRSDLARKIGRRPEQVTRWLSAPANLESDTVSDMALGMGYVPKLTFVSVHESFTEVAATNNENEVAKFVTDVVNLPTGREMKIGGRFDRTSANSVAVPA